MLVKGCGYFLCCYEDIFYLVVSFIVWKRCGWGWGINVFIVNVWNKKWLCLCVIIILKIILKIDVENKEEKYG